MHLANLCLRVLIPSKKKAFSWSPKYVYCLYDAFIASILCSIKDGISVFGTDRSQKEPYQENMGDEEGFQIHIQLQQSWQLVKCGQGHCPARAEHHESVFLAFFLGFPGVAALICLHNMHCLSYDLTQDNQS